MSWTEYKRLIDERNADPEAWAAAANANPNDPLTACKVAVEADPWAAADTLLTFARKAPDLLTTEQVAERMGVAKRTVQSWVQKGLLPTVETPIRSGKGTVSLIPAQALETFEPPPVGYPKGRPRTKDPDASDSGQAKA